MTVTTVVMMMVMVMVVMMTIMRATMVLMEGHMVFVKVNEVVLCRGIQIIMPHKIQIMEADH